jgi:hypothetical protein
LDATVGQRLGEETPRSKAREVATARDEDDVSRYVPEVDGAQTKKYSLCPKIYVADLSKFIKSYAQIHILTKSATSDWGERE